MALKPSSSGSPEVASLWAPMPATEGFSHRIMKAETMSVKMPARMPRGMSRLGSTDSSAASGSCSMARNSHTAKGRQASTPMKPLGRKGPLPSGSALPSAPTFMAHLLKSMLDNALTQNTIRQASASNVTTNVTLNDSSTPMMFSPTNRM